MKKISNEEVLEMVDEKISLVKNYLAKTTDIYLACDARRLDRKVVPPKEITGQQEQRAPTHSLSSASSLGGGRDYDGQKWFLENDRHRQTLIWHPVEEVITDHILMKSLFISISCYCFLHVHLSCFYNLILIYESCK